MFTCSHQNSNNKSYILEKKIIGMTQKEYGGGFESLQLQMPPYSAVFSASMISLVGKVFFSTGVVGVNLSLLKLSMPDTKAMCSSSCLIAKKQENNFVLSIFLVGRDSNGRRVQSVPTMI